MYWFFKGSLHAHLTRLSFETQATLGAKLGTLGCAASLNFYGNRLNIWTKGEGSACYVKPPANIVEANITCVSRGSYEQKEPS